MLHALKQAPGRFRQDYGIGRRALFGPCGKGLVELLEGFADARLAGLPRQYFRQRQCLRQRLLEIGREQHAFAQPSGAARCTDIVEQRQQHDRDVAMAALQAFQVIRQQHGAAHQRTAGFVAVAGGVFLQRAGQQFQFLGHHRRGVEFDHAQGALHLVQIAGAEMHARSIRGIFGEELHLGACQAQGFIQLGLDPAQHCVAHRIA